MNHLPIIYVRGYAGPTAGINSQVDDPFYGFNEGATHLRVGGDGDPMYYQFEGPMLRLMIDEGYQLLVHGDQRAFLEGSDEGELDPASIWVYRFYDQAATTFAAPPHQNVARRIYSRLHEKVSAQGFDIEEAAAGLYDLIELVLRKTRSSQSASGGSMPKQVIIVAHSMGGLVARCMMQKVCPRTSGNSVNGTREPSGDRRPAKEIVAKFFTYGTPHGGIVFQQDAFNWIEEFVGPAGSDIFAPDKMYGYLEPDAKFGQSPKSPNWDPQRIPSDVLDVDNIFCLVGTDSKDYGNPKIVVGPKSDGLVRIENAYVRGAHRAFAYKSHSGSYGEVNSEEGYQNLRRFLFGRWKVRIDFVRLPASGGDDSDGPVWQADMRLSVRGLPVVLSEQRADHYCPIQLNDEIGRRDTPDHPVPLLSMFLLDPSAERARGDDKHNGRARYSLTLRVAKLVQRDRFFDFSDHLEQVFDWADALIVDVAPNESNNGLSAWMAWNSAVSGSIDELDPIVEGLSNQEDRHPVDLEHSGNQWSCTLDLPEIARGLEVFGSGAQLKITITDCSVAGSA